MTPKSVERPVLIDLFCGAGGMSLGFEQAGFDVLLGIDADPYHVAAHERNFPYGKAVMASVCDVSGDSIREMLGGDREIDLVIGGPPCQGFSTMGLRFEGDPRNSLVDEYARLVKELRPRAFVMENVSGMAQGNTAPIFDRFVLTMKQAGYRLTTPVRVLNAADFGVPQNRRRLFAVGVRDDVPGEFKYPDGPVTGQPPRPTAWEAIADLPEVESHSELFKTECAEYDKLPDDRCGYALVARGLAADPSNLGHRRDWNGDSVSGCMRTRHAEKTVALYDATEPGTMVPGHKLPRIDPEALAPTLRAGTDSKRGSHTAPRPIHPFSPRVITAREAARLHGFPDWFAFYSGKWHSYRQVGNAVCPPVARAIGYEVAHALGYSIRGDSIRELTLPTDFVLIESRPKHQRRVSAAVELPKVIDYLWEKAFDSRAGKVKNPSISTDDIEAAIRSTGAKTPTLSPDRLLSHIQKSRVQEAILKTPLEHGCTIRLTDPSLGSGEFVPVGAPGAFGDNGKIVVRSADVSNSLRASLEATLLDTEAGIASLLEVSEFLSDFSDGQWRSAEVDRALFGIPEVGPFGITLQESAGGEIRATVVARTGGAIPDLAQMGRILSKSEYSWLVVLVKLTNRHVLAVAAEAADGTAEIRFREVFELNETPKVNEAVQEAVRKLDG